MKKILIKDNAFTAEQDIVNLYDLVEKLNGSFLSEFNELNVGDLTTEILKDCFLNNCHKVDLIFRKQANDDIKSITNIAIKKSHLSLIEPLIEGFKKISNDFKNNNGLKFVEYLEVENGVIIYSTNAIETIREKAKYYIDDPIEIEIYNKLKGIIENYNDLMSIVGPRCKMSIRIRGIEDFLEVHQTTYKVKHNEDLDYSLMLK